MASSSVRDVFLSPKEQDINILQEISDRNRKRNASIASDTGYFSEDSHGPPKIRAVTVESLPVLEGDVFAAENIWDIGVGYSPCQSPKLDAEELIPCDDENGEEHDELNVEGNDDHHVQRPPERRSASPSCQV